MIPGGLVELPRQDYERWQTLARRVDTFDCRDPVSVTWLYSDSSAYSVGVRDDLRRCCDPHHEAGLVKVVDVVV